VIKCKYLPRNLNLQIILKIAPTVDPTIGYFYRQLPEPVMTGIYECNSRYVCSWYLDITLKQDAPLRPSLLSWEDSHWISFQLYEFSVE